VHSRWLSLRCAPAARAGVHGGDELEVGGEGECAAGARDGDDVVFERLAHDFEGALGLVIPVPIARGTASNKTNTLCHRLRSDFRIAATLEVKSWRLDKLNYASLQPLC
jgi:hypothetical protein